MAGGGGGEGEYFLKFGILGASLPSLQPHQARKSPIKASTKARAKVACLSDLWETEAPKMWTGHLLHLSATRLQPWC